MSEKKEDAEVLDFSAYKMNKMLLNIKRNPKATQAEVTTLQAVLDLYLNGHIDISWVEGEPYMSLSPNTDLDEEELKEKFNEIINGG